MTPVILSRQQLDQLWEIDRSEIIDTLYRLDAQSTAGLSGFYCRRAWLGPSRSSGLYSIHEACYDRGGIFFAFFDDEQMIAAAALDTFASRADGADCASYYSFM